MKTDLLRLLLCVLFLLPLPWAGCGPLGSNGAPTNSSWVIALPPCELARRYEGYVRGDPAANDTEKLVAAATVSKLCSGKPLTQLTEQEKKQQVLEMCTMMHKVYDLAVAGKATCAGRPGCTVPATRVPEALESWYSACHDTEYGP